MKKPKRPVMYLTSGQAARQLNANVNTIRRWAKKGVIPAIRVGTRGDLRIPVDELKAWTEASRIPSHDVKQKLLALLKEGVTEAVEQ